MKRYISLFLLTLLLLPPASTQRKPSEEAEHFLQTALLQQPGRDIPGEEKLSPVTLFNAEQEYRFTPTQRLQLKRLILQQNYRIDKLLMDKLSAEAEAAAMHTGNDSLLCDTRWDIFRYQLRTNDTAAAHVLLQRQTPLVRTLYGEERLKTYYYALANSYNQHNRPETCFYWLRKARPGKPSSLYSWYNQMAAASIRFDRYADALSWADSCLAISARSRLNASGPTMIKGRALRNLGRTAEALRFYAEAVATIDSLAPTRKKKGYSHYELYIFYDYASLLQQARRYREAIPLLTRVTTSDRTLLPDNKSYRYNVNDTEHPPINAALLLSQCYYSIGRKDLHARYTRLADSLQNASNDTRLKINVKQLEERYRNELLSSQLLFQEEATASAQHLQYLLAGLIVLLVTILAIAAGWWYRRRRRLRQLFMLMTERHADWLAIRSLLLEQPSADITQVVFPVKEAVLPAEEACPTAPPTPLAPVLSLPEAAPVTDSPLVYRRIFHNALRVMETDQPFLDPKFDLPILARLVGTNRTQLSVAINQQAQTTFSNWLAAYRVNYLIRQIDGQTDRYIDELYPTAGFASRTTFYRQFRQVTGLTPKQYMKERSDNVPHRS